MEGRAAGLDMISPLTHGVEVVTVELIMAVEGLKNIWTISTVFKLQIKYLCDFDTHNYLVVHIII